MPLRKPEPQQDARWSQIQGARDRLMRSRGTPQFPHPCRQRDPKTESMSRCANPRIPHGWRTRLAP
eukprot:6910239-Heterocapsa_arctica.AAC.1